MVSDANWYRAIDVARAYVWGDNPAAIVQRAIVLIALSGPCPLWPAHASGTPPSFQLLAPHEGPVHIDARSWTVSEAGFGATCITKGRPTAPPIIVQESDGEQALRIELDPTPKDGTDGNRDKINYRIVGGNQSDAPHFGGPMTYLSFSVKFDPDSFDMPTSGRGYLIAQWWQGTPFSPPLALDILPAKNTDGDVPVVLAIRNSETGGNPSARTIFLALKGNPTLKRGRWYHFLVGTRFGIHADGTLEVWVDNKPVPEVDWHGSVGYDAALIAGQLGYKTGPKLERHPNKTISVLIGPYRDRMQSRQVFYFKDIAYGLARSPNYE